MNFYKIEWLLRIEAVECHIGFYTSLSNIYLNTFNHHEKWKIHDIINTKESISFGPSFPMQVLFLHSVLPHPLICSLCFSLFYMLHYTHMHICLHISLARHAYAGEHAFFSFWDCVTFLNIICSKSSIFLKIL